MLLHRGLRIRARGKSLGTDRYREASAYAARHCHHTHCHGPVWARRCQTVLGSPSGMRSFLHPPLARADVPRAYRDRDIDRRPDMNE